jgi:hypothetical protein
MLNEFSSFLCPGRQLHTGIIPCAGSCCHQFFSTWDSIQTHSFLFIFIETMAILYIVLPNFGACTAEKGLDELCPMSLNPYSSEIRNRGFFPP